MHSPSTVCLHNTSTPAIESVLLLIITTQDSDSGSEGVSQTLASSSSSGLLCCTLCPISFRAFQITNKSCTGTNATFIAEPKSPFMRSKTPVDRLKSLQKQSQRLVFCSFLFCPFIWLERPLYFRVQMYFSNSILRKKYITPHPPINRFSER
jgi:hypothetical protein